MKDAVIKDGKDNIRYLVVDMHALNYAPLVSWYTLLHTRKESGNKLTVIPNIAKTEAIVKIVAHVGWLEEEAETLSLGIDIGLITHIYTYSQLNHIYDLLRSVAWPEDPGDEKEE